LNSDYNVAHLLSEDARNTLLPVTGDDVGM
jgi:hypothetical protein